MQTGKKLLSFLLSLLMLSAISAVPGILPEAEAAVIGDVSCYNVEMDFYMSQGSLTEDYTYQENGIKVYFVGQNGLTYTRTFPFTGKSAGSRWTLTLNGENGVPCDVYAYYKAERNTEKTWGMSAVRVTRSEPEGNGDPLEPFAKVLWSGNFGMTVKGTRFTTSTASCELHFPNSFNSSGTFESFYSRTDTYTSPVQPQETCIYPSLGLPESVTVTGSDVIELPLYIRYYDQYGASWNDTANQMPLCAGVWGISGNGNLISGISISEPRIISLEQPYGNTIRTRMQYLTIDPAQLKNNTDFTITVSSTRFQNKGQVVSEDLTVVIPARTVRFVNNTTLILTQTLRVGDVPSPPSPDMFLPEPTETSHYVIVNWHSLNGNFSPIQPVTHDYPSEVVFLAHTEEVGHTFAEVSRTDPTCTEGGIAVKRCSVCGYEKSDTLPPEGHQPVRHPAQAPTCTEPGWNAFVTCKNCPYTTFSAIPASGHSPVDVEAAEATATEHGYTAGTYCPDCDTWLSGHETVHNKLGGITVLREPTEDEEGLAEIYCTVCGEKGLYAVELRQPAQEEEQEAGNDSGDRMLGNIRKALNSLVNWFFRLIRWLGKT